MRWCLSFLLALGISAIGADALADARTKARRAFNEGMRLIAQRKFSKGIDRLIEANATVPHPNVQYNIVQAYLAIGDEKKAAEWMRIYLDQPEPPRDAEQIRRRLEELEARLAPKATREPHPAGDHPKPLPFVPNLTLRDVERLEALANDLRSLSAPRAEELDDIAAKMKRSAGETPPPPPPAVVALEPKEPGAPKLSEGALRVVEEYEEREVVTAATRDIVRPQDAPAVVWVITQREIRYRGYETIAEALRAVAGLHVIDDHVFIDVGVRGVHAGLRGMSRIIKVLVDGHPVSFRPTSGSFLGLEAIPIRAVDRIELIRGPASALYGANAFLGVLQIVTRKGGDIRGGSVTGRIGMTTSTERVDGSPAPNLNGSGDAIVGTKEGDLSLVVAAQAGYLDRSGLRLPKSSPYVDELTERTGGVSAGDVSKPFSAFGSLVFDLHSKGQLSVTGGAQRLESRAEWLDYGALTHFTEISLYNLWARLAYDLQVSKEAGFRAFTSYSQGGPTNEHRIRFFRGFTFRPDETRHLTEDYDSKAIFSGLEMRWDLLQNRLGVRIGADLDVDFQKLYTARAVFDAEDGDNQPGDSIPAARSSLERTTFTNVGLYLQVSSRPWGFLDVVGGLRYDFQSLYGSNLNGRLGAVLRASDWLYFKALYGSSFRAPAADQLYRGAAYFGDATGCLDYAPCAAVDLEPQTAHTGELVAGMTWDGAVDVRAQVTGFVSFVNDLILSFPNNANAFVTTNAGTRLSRGVELEAALEAPRIEGTLDVGAHGYFAFQVTDSDIPQSLFDPAESIRAEYREASLFPAFTGGGGVHVAYLPIKLGLYVEGRYVGDRRASGSNLALSLGFSNYEEDEDLPGYFELDLNLSTRDLYIVDAGETVLSLRVTDVLGEPHAEGGFRGWDIPAPGRLIFFRIIQEY